MKTTRFSLLFSVLLLFSFNINAEQMKKLGTWEVHYIAFGSTFLTPEIAKVYGIDRSRYSGLINISVLDTSKEGKPAQAVNMKGVAKNLLGQRYDIDFQEIREGKSIYYIAQVKYRNEETFNFDIQITQGSQAHQLKFSQKFYVD
ncbi:DUF4426 domain-containing protein [Algicola sagamiensis]|uniref:DUF4426 domain-containing protein n=1 Tax=Algicola sagamiensis TaxID=163869 RepID=UPI000365C324|nr:DUF4426 domain-containing protein [Algicola sagamiensis]